MVDGPRLLEVEPEATLAHLHGRDGSLVVELLDRPHSSVRDVQEAIARPKLDAVARHEAALLDPRHVEGSAVARVDDAWEPAYLQLRP
jgi:hypothetical protein